MTSRYASLAVLLALSLFLAGCAAPSRPDDAAQDVARPIVFDAALWQAARETVDFLPLETTDPITGTIETGWGSPRGVLTERYRIIIHLSYGRPYAQAAAAVTVLRQTDTADGWIDSPPDPKMAKGLAQDIARSAAAYAELHRQQ